MKRRNLSDKLIRALAYEVAADELESSLDSSEHINGMCEINGGSDDDIDALRRRLQWVAKMLRKRAAGIEGQE